MKDLQNPLGVRRKKRPLRIFCACLLLLSFRCVFLYAQEPLKPGCVVSILNRTVEVQPDGTWVLPNVPANIGQVRARATCIDNGTTKSGQSDFFIIQPNSMNAISPFTL